MAAESLAKAQAFSSGKACCGLTQQPVLQPPPAYPSMLLAAQVTNCYSRYQTVEGCVPESIKIGRVEQRTLDLATNPLDPTTRFSAYARNFPEPCPPIPASYARAGEPVLQGKNCALPNKPDNPVLPG
jgi:hypothetical protein